MPASFTDAMAKAPSLGHGILTVSLAPRDNHEAQVQFALKRGIPAIIGIIFTQRLPFPSAAFDMAHCSRCLILWTEFDRLRKMLAAMCFKLYNMKGDIAVRQKSPDTTAFYDKLTPITMPAKCDHNVDPDAAWYVPMRSCVTAPNARRPRALPVA